MSLTKKIGSYLCTAAMVFSLNVKSDALVKEILQVPGVMVESFIGVALLCDETTSKVVGLFFLFDAHYMSFYCGKSLSAYYMLHSAGVLYGDLGVYPKLYEPCR